MKILCEPRVKPEKVLVHICCAPDAAYGTMKIAEYFGTIIGFYYNPNIWPHDEYKKRLRGDEKDFLSLSARTHRGGLRR